MKKILLFLVLACISVYALSAQDTIPPNKKKDKPEKSFLRNDRPWSIEIPIWIPGFGGDFVYGEIDLEGEDGTDPGDPDPPDGNIWSRLFTSSSYLKFFFIARAAYMKGRFVAQFDTFGGGIGNSVTFNFNQKEWVSASLTVVLSRLFAGYSFYQVESKSKKLQFKIYGFAGIRLHTITLTSNLGDYIERLNVSPVIVEPIVGIRLQMALKNWLFVLQSDIGGFYINTNLSSMSQLISYYRLSNLLSLKAGWMDWDINHQSVYLKDELKVKIHLSGPSAGLVFHF